MKLVKAGESHGEVMVGILSNVPAGIQICENQINLLLSERNNAFGRSVRQALESDKINTLTGVRNGVTMGNNVAIIIENSVHGDYGNMMGVFSADESKGELTAVRPGHADLPGVYRFGISDARNVLEGASARNTCLDVAGGAFAIKMLEDLGIKITAFVKSLGGEKDENNYTFSQVEKVKAPCFTVDKQFEKRIKKQVELCEKNGDSVGGSVEIYISGIKPGFGCYMGEKRVNSVIAQHIMQIQAVKGFYFGAFPFDGYKQSEYADSVGINNGNAVITSSLSGGIDGGMTNGAQISLTVGIKPIPTTKKGTQTLDIQSKTPCVSARERADVTAVFALCPILKSVVALAFSEVICERLGCDNMQNIIKRYNLL